MNLPLPFLHRTIRLRVSVLLLTLLSLAGTTQAQAIRYVKPTASGNGSGSSWANASNNLQAMIDASDSGQQVWVAGGTYRPAAISSFSMKDGVAVYGGFAGNESRLADRTAINPVAGRPSSSTLGGNGRSVISNPPGLTSAARLDGFVITGGNAVYGGGMYNVGGSSPGIANCSFLNNTGNDGLGGGMYNRGSSNPVLTNCLFQGNTAPEGGGMCNAGSSPTLTNCLFQSNRGTAIFCYGAGMYNLGSSSPTLTNCSFLTNSISDGSGGGMYNENNSNPNLANCLFQGNSAPNGGGMYNESNCNPALINCSFLNNTASYGGGIDNSGSSPRLTNCSFQNNSASKGGAIDSFYGSGPVLTNCVVFGNGGANTFSGDKLTASYCLFEESATNYTDGGHNLTTPRTPFLTTTSTQLNGCASAINTGSNDAYTTANGPASDLAGNARTFPANGRIDRGAYEYQANPTTFSLNNPAVSTATVGQLFSQAFTAGGGSSPYSYGVASGTLPAGLSLSAAGVLSGIPTQSGSFNLTVRAQDANGCAGVGSPYALLVNTLIRYVKPTASGTGSGSSWANASGNLQAMIDASGSGQQVWVQDGTYQPAADNSFAMKDGVGIYGGFAGNESRIDDRPAVNPLSGQPARSTLKGNGNSVIHNPVGLSRTALLDGFILTGGSVGLDISVFTGGGGMYNENSSPMLTNCSFQSNSAYYGGGMLNINSSPMLTNCSFQSNTATLYGGGMFNQGSNNPVLTNCSFQSNSAVSYGGGMLNSNSNPTMVNCSFQGNRGESGGVMYNRAGSNPVLTNGVVFGNGGANTFYNNDGCSVSASYSLFEASVTDYTDGGNNFTTTRSPFANTTATKLNNCAPAINTGSNNAYATAGGPAIDLAGQPRTFPANGQIDRGAYEYQASPGSLVRVSTPSVGTATVGAPFSQAFTGSGGASPYSFSMVSSNLPASLSLSTAGLLSGTPTQPGSYSLTVQATDGADGCAGTVSAVYTLTVSPASPIRYVKQRSSGTGSGSSWADASGDLQSQIDLAGAQQVWVATGTYQPAANTSFALKNGVVLYGGFVGTESNLGQRPTVNPLTERPSGSELKANGDRIINNPSGLNNTARLDGFVIAGGDAPTGGGMYNEDSSPGIANCVFQNNKATPNGNGGGMYNLNSSPALTNCLFLNNSAFNGGGIYNSGSNPTLINCSFQGNTAIGYGYGGGMYTTGSTTMRLTNCSFQNNTAHIGGGMFTTNSSSLRLTDCDFLENAASQGGGMYNSGSNPVLTSCSFQENLAHKTIYSSANYGGGIYNDSSSPALTNCSFQGNSADIWGGGIYNYGSSPDLTNCSFQGNRAPQGGGVYNSSRSSASLTNGVVFGNGAANTVYNENGGSVSASYSLFETSVTGYTNGGHNLTTTTSPFVSTTATQLTGCAPALNTGSNAAYASAGGEKTDLADQPRLFPINGPIDMGAYEYQANPTVISLSNPGVSTATAGTPFSQTFTASGGSSPYSYSVVSSNLPASLSLSVAGVLSGTPTQARSYTVLVQARDASGCVGVSGVYSLTVSPAALLVPTLTGFTASPDAVCAGSPVGFTATVGNLTGTYNYTLTNGDSPLTGISSTTAFSQNLTAAGSGSQNFTLTVSSNGQLATATTSVLVNAVPTASLVSSGPLTCAQTSVTLTASGATDDPGSSYTFTAGSGEVLPGSGNTRVVGRTGSYSVTVANASGCISTTSTSVISTTATVTVTNPPVNMATVGVAFSQPFTAGGGTSPYAYSVISSNLPASLSLSTAGVLSGTPTQVGSYSVLVQASDANGCAGTATTAYSLTVSEPVSSIRYVKQGGSGTGSGNSWADASADLQSQIDLAGAQQVWVAAGTYQPAANTSFAMKNVVAIYGGFVGTESSLDQRPAINPLTARPSSSTLVGNGQSVIKNFYATARLDGFLITGGNADYGGGMFNEGGSPTIANCIFQGNSAGSGGGMFNLLSSPRLINCSFLNNSANSGGGMANNSSSYPVLINCSFQGNSAGSGGGMNNYFGSGASLTNCVVFGNGGANTFTGSYGGSVSASYSLFDASVTGYADGGHNLTTATSPFVSTTSTQLNGCAPALNTGNNDAYTNANGPATDLAGNARIYPGGGQIDMGAYEYQAGPTLISVTTPSVTTATVGQPFSQSFTASGGTAPYSFSVVSSNLPASLSLSATGVLSGTPNQTGSYSLNVQASDASGCVGVPVKAYALMVSDATPTLIGFSASPGTVCTGSPVTFTATVGNVTGSYSYTLTNGIGTPTGSTTTGTASTTTFSQNLVASGNGGQSFTLIVSANGYQATAATPVTVNALPIPTLSAAPSATLTCAQTSLTLTADGSTGGSGSLYTFSPNMVSRSENRAVINTTGIYSVTVTNTSGCSGTSSLTIYSNTTPPAPTLLASNGGLLTCARTSLALTAGGSGDTGAMFAYAFAGPGVVSQAGNHAIVNVSGLYSVTVTNTASGCSGTTTIGVTSTTAIVSVTNPAQTMTALGAPFSQPFTASGGVSPYSFSLASGTLPSGLSLSMAGVLSGSATQQGSFPITVSATDANGCTGTGVVYTLSIPSTQFTVLSRDPENGNLYTNTLKPYLLLQNDGNSPIPYGELTVRYWLTVENPVPLRFDVNYAQMGNDKVHFTYVPPSPARQGAVGYIEFSFDGSAGSLAPMSNAVIQDLINKQDYSMFFQGDDYSYVNNANFAPNPHITAYRNGVLVYGTEPGVVADGGPVALSLTASASPNTIIPSGSTTLSANASGGTSPYRYAFTGPGTITSNGSTANVSGLSAGMQTFTVTVTDATQPVNQTVTTTVSVSVTAPPVNQPPVATANANQTATVGVQFAYTVGAFNDETPGSLTYTASINPANGFTFNPATRLIQGTSQNTGVSSVTITATDPGGLSTSTVFTITVLPRPVVTPLSLTLSASATTLLTTGSTTLSAQVSGGTPGYSYTFNGPGAITPNGNTATVQGLSAGTQTFTVVVTDATQPVSQTVTATLSVSVTAPVVGSTQLTVLSRDPDNGQLSTNTLKPYLQLQNDGNNPIPYGEITVRYWLTVENAVPLRYDVNYAQMGNDKVHFTYVPLSPARQGATGYIEFSFDASAGSLAPMSNAVIQDLINKQDYSYFNQGDDYSYVNTGNFAPNPRITAYRNGTLIYGQEPPSGGRQGTEDANRLWTVRVLGNPVYGSELTVEVRGANGQPLRLQVLDLNGHLIGEKAVERAGSVEQQHLPVGDASSGLLFVQVSTPSQTQTVKVLRIK